MKAVRFSPSIEIEAEREADLTREILARMAASQAANSDKHRHAIRDAHAKSHAILKANLTVHEELAPELAQGIFANPGSFPAVVRLSSSPGDIHADRVPAPRGFATKVIGVPGERLLPALGGHNQDFLMVNFPVLAFGTIGKYLQMLRLLEKNAAAPDFFQRIVAGTARLAEGAVQAVGATPHATLQGMARDNNNMLGETFHTQAAVRYGEYIAKLSFAPKSANVRALTGRPVKVHEFSSFRNAVVEHFRQEGADYEVRVQLCTDLEAMPVEDASVPWDENASPQQVVATLRIEPQDGHTPARRNYGDDILSFNPWNGVQAHQPLGSIMRIRKPAYERSSAFRHHQNALGRLEPDSLAQIPD
ncbi:hypothetical protein BJG92_00124 [Arthrobacter sp. SO5]|uniref:catalase family protein n=1 Tax=Arthrobacter sp. SO5 TaxID=1897055 RepID=UPI001E2D34C4|nr:catalase family protein [Arthrobacter sp. SO5]MCB5272622.1 hypothetical protein [Arthrobacter sp. SO5]